MAPNARFWLGDCYYSQQEFELSILEYQKVIADYPNHAKAPAALLKQGLAFEKLKDNETAKIVYKKVLDELASASVCTQGLIRTAPSTSILLRFIAIADAPSHNPDSMILLPG